jgi:threonine dehydrogenase-like Zn-dependent dehydrogenase
MQPLLKKVGGGEVNSSFIMTHRSKVKEVPKAYKNFRDKKDECKSSINTLNQTKNRKV